MEDTLKLKHLSLCRTRWVERINALEVMLDLLEPVADSLIDIASNINGGWNHDTVSQPASLLKSIDFDFIVNLVITQNLVAFTSGITTSLQKRGIDIGAVYREVNLVLSMLEQTRDNVESFHCDNYEQACLLAKKIDVDIKKPQTCRRQTFRSNVQTPSHTELSPEEHVKVYYRCNVTIPMLDDLIISLKDRFCEGQETVSTGIMLLPSFTITTMNWEYSIQPFIDLYHDEVPSYCNLLAEIKLWKMKWTDIWDMKWKCIQEQHVKATHTELKLSASELNKLKRGAVPSSVNSCLGCHI